MVIIGIDPGISESHYVAIDSGRYATDVYAIGNREAVEIVPGQRCALLTTGVLRMGTYPRTELLEQVRGLLRTDPAAIYGIEEPRGVIYQGRAADPVLQDAMMAGELLGMLIALDRVALRMPAAGTHAGFSWHTELGMAGLSDHGVALGVASLLDAPLPTGPRGGHVQHYADAAAVALATASRLSRRREGESLEEAFYRLTPLETAQIEHLGRRRKYRKLRRSLE